MALYIISAVLMQLDALPGKTTTKLVQGYRGASSEDAAVGNFLSTMLIKFPNWGVQSFLVMEVPAEDIIKIQQHMVEP